jgi:AcrR family transcriptional regulator
MVAHRFGRNFRSGNLTSMSVHFDPSDPGLRERKKLRTRALLIDAALDLAARQGYEHTTVEQIAEAVEVSPRTFARYFPTKDSAILALLDHLTSAVNAELEVIPTDVPPFEALLAANIAMLRRADGAGAMTISRITALLRIVNASPTLQILAIDLRTQETTDALTKRLSSTYDDRTIQLISATWAAIIASAWGALGTDAQPISTTATDLPELMHRLLVETFSEFAEVSSDLLSRPS